MSAPPSVRELRALDVVDVVPAGCFALLIKGEAWAPHLRPGELAIVDTAETVPQIGELYALMIQTRHGDRPFVVQPFRSRVYPAEAGTMYRFAARAMIDGVTIAADGPLSPAGWAGKCRGRIVGVMLAMAANGS